MDLLVAVLLPLAAAPLMPLVRRLTGRAVGEVAALVPLTIGIYLAQYLPAINRGEDVSFQLDWVPEIGLALSLRLDGLSLLFVLLITLIGTLVCIYAGGYLAGGRRLGSFFSYLLAFMTAMLGIVLSENLLTLYVFWEFTTLTSFLLISYEYKQPSARAAAMQALLTTAAGGLCLLAGMILLGSIGGSFEISTLIANGETVRNHELYPAAALLVLLGAFTKSAQFPFHYWLPNAMAAPTPVSAYLHSATMVKAGVYLLARLTPLLGGTELWTTTVTGVGAITMLVGAVLAFTVRDMKGILAYLTINVLGTLTMLIGIGTGLAVEAAMLYLLAHALYKGALFLVTGAVDHAAHTRDIGELGGLRHRMPLTATVAVLAALSMAGVVPFFGFLAKETYLNAAYQAPGVWPLLTLASLITSVLVVAGALLIGFVPFFGTLSKKADHAHEAGVRMWIGPALLAVTGLLAGMFPQTLIAPLIESAATAVLGEPPHFKLKLWHGLSVPLLMSIIALAGGVALFVFRDAVGQFFAWARSMEHWGPAGWYDTAVVLLDAVAHWQTGFLQSGYLRTYVTVILAMTAGLSGLMITHFGLTFVERETIGVRWHEGIAAGLIVVAAFVAVRSTSRMRAVVALTIVGFGVSWIFVLFGGPDLAMTQIVVETLTTLLFVFAFYRLPKFSMLSSRADRLRDALLASAVGVVMTLLVLLATGLDQYEPISEQYVLDSVPKAHGRNIVNVILVDFRALDTLGEITVLSAAAAGVFVMVRLTSRKGGRA